MENYLTTPHFGMKFIYLNTEYEIVSVYLNEIGIASVIGGKRKNWSKIFFDELIKKDQLTITFSKSKILQNSTVFHNINRKYKYIEQALKNTHTPHSSSNLHLTINIISKIIDDQLPPSSKTLSNWIRTYISSNYDIKSLIDKRTGNTSSRKPWYINEALNQALKKTLNSPFKHSAEDIHIEMIQYLSNSQLPYEENQLYSLRQIQRLKKQHHDQYSKDKSKNSVRFAQNNCKASGQKIVSEGFLNIVEIDSHELDLVIIDAETCTVKGRPWITLAIDIYTRICVGYYLSEYPPNAYTTLQVMKNMVTGSFNGIGGIPDILVPDNGPEFINNSVLALARELHITLNPAQVKTPDNKPYVERFFGTLAHKLIQKIPGTTFSNRILIEEYNSKKYAALTLEQTENCILKWIEIYHKSMHSGIDRVPLSKYKEAIKSYRPIIIEDDHADFICRVLHYRSISNGQIQYQNLFYYSHALRTLENKGLKDVTIYINESDLSNIYVKSNSEDELIEAISTEPKYTLNLTLYDHYIVQDIKRRMKAQDLKDYPYSENILARIALNTLIINFKKQNKKNFKKFIDLHDPLDFINTGKGSQSSEISPNKTSSSKKIEFGEFESFSYEKLDGDDYDG